MPLELKLDEGQSITEEDLVQMFRCFCEAFGIEVAGRDEKFMREQGLSCLNEPVGIDYRPYMGAKFFGKRTGNYFCFHGYSEPDDPEQEIKDKRFEELALESLRNKN